MTRKIFPLICSVLLIFSFSSPAKAEFFSISAGVPVAHSISNSNMETDGVNGFFAHFKLPIMIGLGIETYETGIDYDDPGVSDMSLKTNMYDIFWLTPVPVVNFTIGAGLGTVELECDVADGSQCSDFLDKGGATQIWAQLGFNVLPLLDLHVSYHQISGTVGGKNGADDEKIDGTVYGVGASFIF